MTTQIRIEKLAFETQVESTANDWANTIAVKIADIAYGANRSCARGEEIRRIAALLRCHVPTPIPSATSDWAEKLGFRVVKETDGTVLIEERISDGWAGGAVPPIYAEYVWKLWNALPHSSRPQPSWTGMMSQTNPCGHTNAQHMYYNDKELALDMKECPASRDNNASLIRERDAEIGQISQRLKEQERRIDCDLFPQIRLLKGELAERDATIAEQAKEIGRLQAMMELAVDDWVFFTRHEDGIGFALIVNDVYYPAADAEALQLSDAPEVLRIYKEGGNDAVINWVTNRRGIQPRKRVIERMQQNKELRQRAEQTESELSALRERHAELVKYFDKRGAENATLAKAYSVDSTQHAWHLGKCETYHRAAEKLRELLPADACGF